MLGCLLDCCSLYCQDDFFHFEFLIVSYRYKQMYFSWLDFLECFASLKILKIYKFVFAILAIHVRDVPNRRICYAGGHFGYKMCGSFLAKSISGFALE